MSSSCVDDENGGADGSKAVSTGEEMGNDCSLWRSRQLTNEHNVFAHNAWDDVTWDEEMTSSAQKIIMQNSSTKMDSNRADDLLKNANKNWDSFYEIHENKFFKDRNWLLKEFPELLNGDVKSNQEYASAGKQLLESKSDELNTKTGSDSVFRIFETGCGVGNTIFPLLNYIDDNSGSGKSSSYFIYGCDFSSTAIGLTHKSEYYDEARCHTFVWDLTDTSFIPPFELNSLDIITMVFVLSAIQPRCFKSVIDNLVRYLKPGGFLLFRDYGLFDMAQLRFKSGKCIEDNFYSRGDGTQVYFFTQVELHDLFVGCGLNKVQNLVDRRLQVNRGKQLKMYRVWIQCKYQK